MRGRSRNLIALTFNKGAGVITLGRPVSSANGSAMIEYSYGKSETQPHHTEKKKLRRVINISVEVRALEDLKLPEENTDYFLWFRVKH